MLTSPFSKTLCNRCLICWRLSFGWEREILDSGEKGPLIPDISSQQNSRWLSSVRLKAQRTAVSFVILKEEGDHLEIRKSIAITDGGQYEICWNNQLFWVLTVLSPSFGYGFTVEAFQVMEGATPQKTLTDFIMQAQITSLDRNTHSFLAVHRQKPPTEPSLAPCTALSWVCASAKSPNLSSCTLQQHPPRHSSPHTLNFCSQLQHSFTGHKEGGEQGPFTPWSFPPSKHKISLILKYKKALRRIHSCLGHPTNAAHFSPAPVQSPACDRVQSKATASPWQGLSWQSQLQRNRLMLIYPLSTAFQGVGAFEESKAIGSSFLLPQERHQLSRKLNKQIKEESF